jgi:hypothetical protein
VVDQTIAAGLLPSEVRAFYDQLPVRPDPGNFINDKDDFVKAIFNTQDELLGYDRLGLDDNLSTADGLIDATLLTGDYVNVHNYGWSEFTIDEQTQQLRVTTWGIETYTPEELRAEPQDIVSRTPEVVSEFIVNPRFDDTVGSPSISLRGKAVDGWNRRLIQGVRPNVERMWMVNGIIGLAEQLTAKRATTNIGVNLAI